MNNDITTVRDEVTEYLPDWTLVRDVLGGERIVKSRTTTYLPKPNPTDLSEENTARYNQYIERALVLGATKRTLDGMIGIAFRRWPEIVAPPKVEEVLHDLDGASGSLVNQARRCLEETLSVGRCGLLVDYPATDGATSQADEREQNIHPTVTLYRAEQIINWRSNERGRLTLVVLHEMVEDYDSYSVEWIDQYRELAMEEGVYTVRVWRDGESGFGINEEFRPVDGSGRPWQEIPFQFVGATDNDAGVDRAPLYDLANVNIAHYRNSADYEESVFFSGQPTVAVSGMTQSWLQDVLKGTITVGSRAGIPLPEGGSIQLVQAGPNTLAGDAMLRKEQQMVALGARLLTPGEAAKTAEQSRAETAAAHSVLSLACDNVSEAYTQALTWVARFTPADEMDVAFTIHTDFTGLIADPNLIQALVAGWQSGAYPKADMWAALRQIGIIDPEKTDDDLDEELDAEGGGLDLGTEVSMEDAGGFAGTA